MQDLPNRQITLRFARSCNYSRKDFFKNIFLPRAFFTEHQKQQHKKDKRKNAEDCVKKDPHRKGTGENRRSLMKPKFFLYRCIFSSSMRSNIIFDAVKACVVAQVGNKTAEFFCSLFSGIAGNVSRYRKSFNGRKLPGMKIK